MNGRSRIRYGGFAYAAVLLTALYSLLHISWVVERVEDTQDIATVLYCLLDKFVDHVVCIMLISKDILTSEKHLQLGLRHSLFQSSQSLPWVLVEESKTGVKRSSAPALDRIITCVVKFFTHRQHLVQSHTGSRLRLVSVTQNSLCNFNHNKYACHVRSHCVHQQIVVGVFFLTDHMRYSRSHRHSRYSCRTDKRIDLAL